MKIFRKVEMRADWNVAPAQSNPPTTSKRAETFAVDHQTPKEITERAATARLRSVMSNPEMGEA